MNLPILILASNSPRRKQLLKLAGWDFSVCPADIDETPLAGEAPNTYTLRLAEEKACAAAAAWTDSTAPGVVLASDTTVVDTLPDGRAEILGKPADPADAVRMLRQLRGRTHQVLTALAVLRISDGTASRLLATTSVRMRTYTDEEISTYVASGDPLDKAGAYAIQHAGFHPVEQISGCYAAVMGLPLCRVPELLVPLGFSIPPKHAELAVTCRAGFPPAGGCPVEQWLV